jgi:hypothetical protein
MCSAGGSAAPAQQKTPPQPETVKRVSTEVAQVREAAKQTAAKQYGIGGTDATRNKLSAVPVETKKNKLGGV